MNHLSKNSTTVSPAAQEFRTKAISFIGNLIRSRAYCVSHGKGRKVAEVTIRPVREQYKAYRKTWTVKGVASFIIRYQDNLIDMHTGGAKQIQKLIELIETAKKYTA